MAAENGVGDAINESRMLPHERFKCLAGALHLIELGITAVNRGYSAQDRFSRHHSSALKHEDRPLAGFVQEFLKGRTRAGEMLAIDSAPGIRDQGSRAEVRGLEFRGE